MNLRPFFVTTEWKHRVVATWVSPAVVAFLPLYIGYICGSDPHPVNTMVGVLGFIITFSMFRNAVAGWVEAKEENKALVLALRAKEKAEKEAREKLLEDELTVATLFAAEKDGEFEDHEMDASEHSEPVLAVPDSEEESEVA